MLSALEFVPVVICCIILATAGRDDACAGYVSCLSTAADAAQDCADSIGLTEFDDALVDLYDTRLCERYVPNESDVITIHLKSTVLSFLRSHIHWPLPAASTRARCWWT